MKLTLVLILAIATLPLVSAYNGFGFGSFTPSDIISNQWILFGIIFIALFAFIFLSLNNFFKSSHGDDRRGIVAIISVLIAFFIAASLTKGIAVTGVFNSIGLSGFSSSASSWFGGDQGIAWLSVIGFIVIFFFSFIFYKAMKKKFGMKGSSIAIITFILWLLLNKVTWPTVLAQSPSLMWWVDNLKTVGAIIIIELIYLFIKVGQSYGKKGWK